MESLCLHLITYMCAKSYNLPQKKHRYYLSFCLVASDGTRGAQRLGFRTCLVSPFCAASCSRSLHLRMCLCMCLCMCIGRKGGLRGVPRQGCFEVETSVKMTDTDDNNARSLVPPLVNSRGPRGACSDVWE